MTAAPHSPLVIHVREAIKALWDEDDAWHDLHGARIATAAIAACHAEELADALRFILPLAKRYAAANPDVAHAKRIETAYALLAKLDGGV